jgi:hypothetical protein
VYLTCVNTEATLSAVLFFDNPLLNIMSLLFLFIIGGFVLAQGSLTSVLLCDEWA